MVIQEQVLTGTATYQQYNKQMTDAQAYQQQAQVLGGVTAPALVNSLNKSIADLQHNIERNQERLGQDSSGVVRASISRDQAKIEDLKNQIAQARSVQAQFPAGTTNQYAVSSGNTPTSSPPNNLLGQSIPGGSPTGVNSMYNPTSSNLVGVNGQRRPANTLQAVQSLLSGQKPQGGILSGVRGLPPEEVARREAQRFAEKERADAVLQTSTGKLFERAETGVYVGGGLSPSQVIVHPINQPAEKTAGELIGNLQGRPYTPSRENSPLLADKLVGVNRNGSVFLGNRPVVVSQRTPEGQTTTTLINEIPTSQLQNGAQNQEANRSLASYPPSAGVGVLSNQGSLATSTRASNGKDQSVSRIPLVGNLASTQTQGASQNLFETAVQDYEKYVVPLLKSNPLTNNPLLTSNDFIQREIGAGQEVGSGLASISKGLGKIGFNVLERPGLEIQQKISPNPITGKILQANKQVVGENFLYDPDVLNAGIAVGLTAAPAIGTAESVLGKIASTASKVGTGIVGIQAITQAAPLLASSNPREQGRGIALATLGSEGIKYGFGDEITGALTDTARSVRSSARAFEGAGDLAKGAVLDRATYFEVVPGQAKGASVLETQAKLRGEDFLNAPIDYLASLGREGKVGGRSASERSGRISKAELRERKGNYANQPKYLVTQEYDPQYGVIQQKELRGKARDLLDQQRTILTREVMAQQVNVQQPKEFIAFANDRGQGFLAAQKPVVTRQLVPTGVYTDVLTLPAGVREYIPPAQPRERALVPSQDPNRLGNRKSARAGRTPFVLGANDQSANFLNTPVDATTVLFSKQANQRGTLVGPEPRERPAPRGTQRSLQEIYGGKRQKNLQGPEESYSAPEYYRTLRGDAVPAQLRPGSPEYRAYLSRQRLLQLKASREVQTQSQLPALLGERGVAQNTPRGVPATRIQGVTSLSPFETNTEGLVRARSPRVANSFLLEGETQGQGLKLQSANVERSAPTQRYLSGVRSVQEEFQLPASRTGLLSGSLSRVANQLAQANALASTQASGTLSIQEPRITQEQRSSQRQATAQALSFQTQPAFVLPQPSSNARVREEREAEKIPLFSVSPRLPPRPVRGFEESREEKTPGLPKKKNLFSQNESAYDVLVRRKGTFRKVNAQGLSLAAAVGLGEQVTKNTLAASFKVIDETTGRPVTSSTLARVGGGYYQSTREAGVLVQSRGTRLGTLGERREIRAANPRGKNLFSAGSTKSLFGKQQRRNLL